jgi:hypothetical protein
MIFLFLPYRSAPTQNSSSILFYPTCREGLTAGDGRSTNDGSRPGTYRSSWKRNALIFYAHLTLFCEWEGEGQVMLLPHAETHHFTQSFLSF